MRQLVICAVLVASACGSSKDAEKEKLDANGITLDPAPGTFAFRPWVILTKSEDGMGSGVLYTKAPGDTEFKSATLNCLSSPYDTSTATVKQGYCVEIPQSGTLTYYLENSAAKSDEKSVDYVVELPTNNVSLATKSAPDAEEKKVDLKERDTYCKYDSDDKLEVFIQTANADALSADRLAYVYFFVKNPKAGAKTKINSANDHDVGVEIKATSDSVPSSILYPTYSTKPAEDDHVNFPEASCEATVDASERGKAVTGKITCANLRSWKHSPEAADEPLGKMISFTANWTCETYQDH